MISTAASFEVSSPDNMGINTQSEACNDKNFLLTELKLSKTSG